MGACLEGDGGGQEGHVTARLLRDTLRVECVRVRRRGLGDEGGTKGRGREFSPRHTDSKKPQSQTAGMMG